MSGSASLHKPQVAEYEKIRKHVVSRIARAGDTPMRLDSTRELARKFGVTHPTVIKALKDLVASGLLTARPGIGVFTNPGKLRNTGNTKLIGVVSGNGKIAFLSKLHWQFGVFAETLQRRSERYLLQSCFLLSQENDSDAIAKELMTSGFDGLLWFEASREILPAMQKLKASGMPALSFAITLRTPDISNFHYDFKSDNQNATGLMLDEGRRKPLLVMSSSQIFPKDEAIEGFKTAFAERGLPFDESLILPIGLEDVDSFADAISIHKPDGLIFNIGAAPFWKPIKEKLDIVDGCRLYSGDLTVFDDMAYTGYVGTPDFSPYAKQAIDNFEAQLKSPSTTPILDCPMKMKISMRRAIP